VIERDLLLGIRYGSRKMGNRLVVEARVADSLVRFLRPRVLLQRGIIGVDFLVGEVDLMSILIHCSVIIHDRIPKRSLSL
jgi:hypothetical protein